MFREEAATIPIGACTALHFLKLANIKPKQKILIYGASGSVGTYAVQLAKHFGAEVTGVCSSRNLALIKSLGADKAIDYTMPDFIQKLEVYDVVFVAVDKLPFSICNKLLAENGIYINVTAPVKNFSMLWVSMTTKKKIIVGQSSVEKGTNLSFLKDLVEADKLKPIIDKQYPMEQIVEAHRYVEKGHKVGNVAITVNHLSA
jgi:NADPH:quinone reductase-like Zn-dependent oxidoreductase